jgi:hypothetical protein
MPRSVITSYGLFESKRVRLTADLSSKIDRLAERLWRMRGRRIDVLTKVDTWLFKTLDGTDAMMQIFVDPQMYDFWGIVDTNPPGSRDPMDLEMRVCHPRHFTGVNDIKNALTHETMHALDPTETTKFSLTTQMGYKWWAGSEEKDYLTHKGEYMTIYSEALASFVRAFDRMSRTHTEATRMSLLDELLRFFASGRLNRRRMSDRLKRLFDRASVDRDFLGLIQDIRTYKPEAHRAFLQKLYDTVGEIRSSISNHGPQGA